MEAYPSDTELPSNGGRHLGIGRYKRTSGPGADQIGGSGAFRRLERGACSAFEGGVIRVRSRCPPTTLRLTAEPLVAASRCKHEAYARKMQIIGLIGGTLGLGGLTKL